MANTTRKPLEFVSQTVLAEDGTPVTLNVPVDLPTEDRAEVLRAAFRLVMNREHWKDAIDAVVDLATLPAGIDLDAILESVEFMTATSASVERIAGTQVRITAPGYWAGPAA